LNFLLSFSSKKILLLSLITILIFILLILFEFYLFSKNNKVDKIVNVSKSDITQPKFSINNEKEKIIVTANEGSFINNDKIMLMENVKFSSNQFTIKSDNVTFDRKQQTAQSMEKSVFRSKNTIITSEGFNIYDNGNKINFYGNTKIILK
tara:strand:- start:19 stop:468 length:450 start_codon:yes stop_codon:yes gene_type:complete